MKLLNQLIALPLSKIARFIPFIALALLLVFAVACAGNGDNPKLTRPESAANPAPNNQATRQQPPAARVIATSEKIVSDGIAIAFAVKPVSPEADLTEINFTLTNSTTGKPIVPESRPAVWVDLERALNSAQTKEAVSCQDKVKLFAQGTVGFRPEIDLNSFFVLALNNDASISVIDPLTGVTGISQLYAMIVLKSRGEDWVLGNDARRLFVTMPEVNQVAVADTDNFQVLQNIDAGNNPVRIALQPDGKQVWVSNDSADGNKSGVTVIDTTELKVVAQIKTSAGEHAIAFSGRVADAHPHDNATSSAPDSTTVYAFVTNRQQGTLTVIDTQQLKKVENINVGKLPAALDFSSVSNAVYVASETDGTITVIDAAQHKIITRINATPGIKTLRFAPGGRWGFAISPAGNTVDVFDATTNRIVHSTKILGQPDKVSFTETYAYIHANQSTDVSLITLSQLGQPGRLDTFQIIGGQTSSGDSPFRSVADVVFPIHEHGSHVLIANPADQYIYYYMEGMKAPMGGFQNYSRAPRAVRVIDRAIRETAPGTYTAKIKIPKSGQYQVAFLLDSPRIVHCFSFTTEPNASIAAEDNRKAIQVQFLTQAREIKAGQNLAFKFALVETQKNVPLSGIEDVYLVATLASGLRSERYRAISMGEGIYEATLTLSMPGVYNIYFSIPSRKMTLTDLSSLMLRVTEGE